MVSSPVCCTARVIFCALAAEAIEAGPSITSAPSFQARLAANGCAGRAVAWCASDRGRCARSLLKVVERDELAFDTPRARRRTPAAAALATHRHAMTPLERRVFIRHGSPIYWQQTLALGHYRRTFADRKCPSALVARHEMRPGPRTWPAITVRFALRQVYAKGEGNCRSREESNARIP